MSSTGTYAKRLERLEALAEDESMRRDAEKLAIAFDMSVAEALDWRREAKRLEAAYRAGGHVPSYAAIAAAQGITLDALMADAERIKQALDQVSIHPLDKTRRVIWP